MVDRLQRDVDGSVGTDGDGGAIEIVVDGRGDADHRKAELAEQLRAGLRAVAADHDEALDAALREVAQRLRAAALLAKLLAARAAEESTADLDDAADLARG